MGKTDKRLVELEEKWKRALADYANLEKRVEEEKEEFVKYANTRVWEKLLTALDDLERCERHIKDEGLKIAGKRFRAILDEEGIKEIEVLGKDFDPVLMEAVEVVPGQKDKVIEVVAKGYLFFDRILRPARVKVGGPPAGGGNKNE